MQKQRETMKATIKATDLLFGKSIEIETSIHKDKSAADELMNALRRRDVRQNIVRGLQLSFGEARLELICYGRVVAEGKMTNSVFGGGGQIKTWNFKAA